MGGFGRPRNNVTASVLSRFDLDQASRRYSLSAYNRSTSLRRHSWVPLPQQRRRSGRHTKAHGSREHRIESPNEAFFPPTSAMSLSQLEPPAPGQSQHYRCVRQNPQRLRRRIATISARIALFHFNPSSRYEKSGLGTTRA
jgi:hypothetical protein